MKAIWNGEVIAQSQDTVVAEGTHYFPLESIEDDYFIPSDTHTTCPRKGEASYLSLSVHGKLNPDAAWFYPNPKDEAYHIKDRVAFGKGVEIVE